MYGYTGLEYEYYTDLNYARARYYKAEIGRFISEDSYLGDIFNPLSHNLYTYVYNNPLIYVDPSGHMGIRQIDDLVLGLFDVVEDNLVATFTWDTYVGLYDFGKGVFTGEITLVDIGKSLGGSALEKVDYFVKNTPKVFGGKPTDHEVRVYGQQLGEVLSLIVRSPSALKILGDISPNIAKRLDPGKGNTNSKNTGKYDPMPTHSTIKNNKLPMEGKPNSSIDRIDDKGNVIQRRYYDENGRASRDVDFTDHGNPKNIQSYRMNTFGIGVIHINH